MAAQAVASIALGLIGLAGIAKLTEPNSTSGALEAARLPSGRGVVRLLGGVEVVAALAGLAIAGMTAAVAALLYAGFAVFTLSGVLKQRPIQSCGCFGRDDTPPSWVHVAYNVTAAVSLAWIAVSRGPTIPWESPLGETLLYMGFAAVGTYGSYLLLSVMPQTIALVNR